MSSGNPIAVDPGGRAVAFVALSSAAVPGGRAVGRSLGLRSTAAAAARRAWERLMIVISKSICIFTCVLALLAGSLACHCRASAALVGHAAAAAAALGTDSQSVCQHTGMVAAAKRNEPANAALKD